VCAGPLAGLLNLPQDTHSVIYSYLVWSESYREMKLNEKYSHNYAAWDSSFRELNLSHCCQITDASLVHLSNLHHLNISDCYRITDIGVAHLAAIRILNLSFCSGITNEGLFILLGFVLWTCQNVT
jgi:hypothetical protein